MNDAISKIAVFAFLLLSLVGASVYFLSLDTDLSRLTQKPEHGFYKKTIWVDGVPLSAYIAKTKEQQEIGLSVFDKLKHKEAMLFVFEKEDKYGIWMKNMKFPIDIFWIDKDGVVVDIAKNVNHDSYPYIFYPKSKAKYILETNSDFAEIYNISIGSRAYKLPK